MPTTYTHDLFGKMVLQKLPEEMRGIIKEHQMAYIIGLHGPDILFYYRPFHKNEVNQTGHRMHGEIAADFFRHCKQQYLLTRDEKVLSYTLGFICHYMLDSSCHPYIYRYTDRTGASHAEIETELDRALMEKNGKNPFRYRPASVVHPDRKTVKVIAALFEGISEKQIRKTLRGMKFYTGILVCRSRWRRRLTLRLMRLTGAYEEVQGRLMRKQHFARCQESTEELLQMVKCAVPETVTVLEEFYRTLEDPKTINYRFSRNYR